MQTNLCLRNANVDHTSHFIGEHGCRMRSPTSAEISHVWFTFGALAVEVVDLFMQLHRRRKPICSAAPARVRIPGSSGRGFRFNPAIHSNLIRSPIPGHPVTCLGEDLTLLGSPVAG